MNADPLAGPLDDPLVLTMPARTELAATRQGARRVARRRCRPHRRRDRRHPAGGERGLRVGRRPGPNSRVSISFVPGESRLDVTIELADGQPIPLDDLASAVLQSVVEIGPDRTPIHFTKRATEAAR